MPTAHDINKIQCVPNLKARNPDIALKRPGGESGRSLICRQFYENL